jgi:hypothetical protein
MVIKVISCTTRRPLARHQPTSSLLASGTRIPGPANSDAETMRALRSSLVSPTVWAKFASPALYPLILSSCSTTRAPFWLTGVGDFAVAVVAVDSSAPGVAGGAVLRGCRADGVARHRHRYGRPLHAGERLLDRESELGVQRQRPVVHGTDPLLNAHVLGSLKLASGDGWRFAWRVGNVDAASVGGDFPAWRPLFRALCHL